jgi:shikimate dehydrogenase
MIMIEKLDGATRLHLVIGDPIAQVKSPGGVSQMLQAQGRNAIVLPIHVAPADLDGFLAGAGLARNLDGVIVTVPHKFAAYPFCGTASERSHFLAAVNVIRRTQDGTWHGDMFDGIGYVEALRDKGCALEGRRVLLAGAGGAGSAIAHALALSGIATLALHDPDLDRRNALATRLAGLGTCAITTGSTDPADFDVVINATPVGMNADDPLPFDIGRLTKAMFVGDVITRPEITPLIEAARALGCGTVIGADMFAKVRDLMVRFLLETDDPVEDQD